MDKKVKIIVIGSTIVDLAVYADRFPVDGETVVGKSLRLGAGGKGSNQATAAHKAGGEVIMVSKLGNDFFKNIILEHYKKEGMTTDYIFQSDEAQTGTAIIEVNSISGQNRIFVMKAANEFLSKEEIQKSEKEIETCDTVLMQLETGMPSIEEGIRLAKKYKKRLIFNPAPPQKIDLELLKGIDYFTPNETEAEFYSGVHIVTADDAKKAAEKLLGLGIENVIITLGKSGALLVNKNQCILIPTTNLKPVDTTGAGDAFNGGFAVAVSEGKDIISSIKFANCTASIKITRKGTSSAMPKREEIDNLYRSFYKE